ncbi:hypothetical protein EAH80_04300 [Mycobacterium hodleri]|uniref:Uncharacterized protein n=1 Tax=Mycolicibacterium hodleri TaxID=49897 RepID=A0A502EKS1_9MYCO|nr:hypothetical protein EAH80_04300 [Mycolicibacterium hodleri]
MTAWHGEVVGQLIRWVWSDGEVGYEARVDGMAENGGFSNACALTIAKCGGIASVANDPWPSIRVGDHRRRLHRGGHPLDAVWNQWS